jgi:hypothetical protein
MSKNEMAVVTLVANSCLEEWANSEVRRESGESEDVFFIIAARTT